MEHAQSVVREELGLLQEEVLHHKQDLDQLSMQFFRLKEVSAPMFVLQKESDFFFF
jgi:hypothetical protein